MLSDIIAHPVRVMSRSTPLSSDGSFISHFEHRTESACLILLCAVISQGEVRMNGTAKFVYKGEISGYCEKYIDVLMMDAAKLLWKLGQYVPVYTA